MKKLILNSRIRKAFQGGSRGFTLVEVMIAVALIGIIAIAFLSALSTASTVLIITDEQATAESLARSQMEDIKNQDGLVGSGDLPLLLVYEKAGYSATIDARLLKLGLQEITIIIAHDGEELVTLVGYKVF